MSGPDIGASVRAAFARRATPTPKSVPSGLSDAFHVDARQQTRWHALLARDALEPIEFADVLGLLRRFLVPRLRAAKAAQIGLETQHELVLSALDF